MASDKNDPIGDKAGAGNHQCSQRINHPGPGVEVEGKRPHHRWNAACRSETSSARRGSSTARGFQEVRWHSRRCNGLEAPIQRSGYYADRSHRRPWRYSGRSDSHPDSSWWSSWTIVACVCVCCVGAGAFGSTTDEPGGTLFAGTTVVGISAGLTGMFVVEDVPLGAGFVVPAGSVCFSGASGSEDGRAVR